MKTFQQIKDEYAQAGGYEDWDNLFEQIRLEKKQRGFDSLEWNMDNISKLYAEQKIKEILANQVPPEPC